MDTLYTTNYQQPSMDVHFGYVLNYHNETIKETIESYPDHKYENSLEQANENARNDSNTPKPSVYYVVVTCIDDVITKIAGTKYDCPAIK